MHLTSQALNPGSTLDFRKLDKPSHQEIDMESRQTNIGNSCLLQLSLQIPLPCGNLADPPKPLPLPLDFLISSSEDFH